jgi:hypothetical protein
MFLIFWRGEPIGWHKHAPKGCFISFWRVGGLISHKVPISSCQYPIKILLFPSSSQKVPIRFLLFLSVTHQYPFFPSSPHQIPLVPINNPSISFCSHQVLKKFPSKSFLFPSSSQTIPINFLLFLSNCHQIHFVPIKFPSNSCCSHQVPKKFPSNSSCFNQVPNKILLFPWLWRIGRWARRWNGETRQRLGQSAKLSTAIRGQAGRGATVAGRRLPRAAEEKVGIFCLPGFVEDRGQICFSRSSLPLLPSGAPPVTQSVEILGAYNPQIICLVPRPCTTANVGSNDWHKAWKFWKYTTHPYYAWSHALVLCGSGMGPSVWNVLNSPLLFIRWSASQVQFSFAAMSQFDWPNTQKMKLWRLAT